MSNKTEQQSSKSKGSGGTPATSKMTSTAMLLCSCCEDRVPAVPVKRLLRHFDICSKNAKHRAAKKAEAPQVRNSGACQSDASLGAELLRYRALNSLRTLSSHESVLSAGIHDFPLVASESLLIAEKRVHASVVARNMGHSLPGKEVRLEYQPPVTLRGLFPHQSSGIRMVAGGVEEHGELTTEMQGHVHIGEEKTSPKKTAPQNGNRSVAPVMPPPPPHVTTPRPQDKAAAAAANGAAQLKIDGLKTIIPRARFDFFC